MKSLSLLIVFGPLVFSLAAAESAQFEKSAQQGEPAAANPASSQPNQEAVQRATANVRKAISVLIPGGIVDGTERKTQLDAVIDKFGRGQARDAMEDLKRLCAADSELPPPEIIMAGLTFAIGDNKSGITLLENSAARNPDYPGVYLSFAQLALNAGRVTDASLHADKTASLLENAKLTDAQKEHFLKQYYEIAASIYSRRKQDARADEMLERLQAVTPNRPFYFFSKAELAFRAGDSDKALEFLKKHAASIESKNLPELTLVDWLKNTGQTEPAEKLLVDTVANNPSDAAAQMMIARMHISNENFPAASDAIRNFEKLNKGETNQSIDLKGRIAFAGGNYELAEAHFRSLNARTRNDLSTQNIYALSLIESKDPEDWKLARQFSGRVVDRMQNNPLALASLGYICLKTGETDLAKRLMQTAVMNQPKTPEISFLLANWLVETNQKDQAKLILQEAVDAKGLFLYRSAARRLLAKLNE